MENIPSTAIIAIAGVILAALLVSFVFLAGQNTIDAGNKVQEKVDEMNVANNEDNYLQYAGSTLEGATVLSILKVYQNDPISITVNGVTYTYADRKANFDEIYRNAKDYNSGTYINPVSDYYCDVEFSATGAVSGLVFTIN